MAGEPPAIPASVERRLSSMQRDASRMALAALHHAGIERPDAIIASTALGCLDDTERFLADMHDANGALLSPLPFMRSTHNTMAGQIALMLRCDGPNITHAQGLDGFHAALVEAELMLHEKPEWNILVIALDERTALLERIAGALDPAINVGAGGEAFVLSGMADGNALARITWAADHDGARMMRDPELALHGSLIAQQLGDAIAAGLAQAIRIGASENHLTDLLISPC